MGRPQSEHHFTDEDIYGTNYSRHTPIFSYKTDDAGRSYLVMHVVDLDRPVERIVTDEDKIIYSAQLVQFYRSELTTRNIIGEPLELLFDNAYTVKALKDIGIYTVEALASINTIQLDKLGMFGTRLFNEALEYLRVHNPSAKLQASSTKLDTDLSNLEKLFAENQAKLDQLVRQQL